jgi:hypothetical protein
MPEEIEIETKDLQETVDEMREEREEREKEAKANAWTRYISLSTAMFAVVAAIAALQAGSLVNEGLVKKNEAVLNQAKASDQWAYYQAKGIKANGAEQTAVLLSTNSAQKKLAAKWQGKAGTYKSEQAEIQNKARELEAERDKENEESEAMMKHHEVFALCVTFTQVAIALSAIAALTRLKPVWFFSILVGAIGLICFANGFAKTAASAKAKTAATAEQQAPGETAPKPAHAKEPGAKKPPKTPAAGEQTAPAKPE